MTQNIYSIAMGYAINLAQEEGIPLGPNPRVGCVFIDQHGEYVAQGAHQGKGTSHAEILALNQLGKGLGEITVVSTLEPCYQPNRPDDCARTLLKSGIKRIVFAQSDTTPNSRGGGDFLQANGVEVIRGLLEDESSGINPWLTVAMTNQRPYVRLKIAASLDGKVATANGSSRWISGPQSRNYVHQLRSQSHFLISSAKSVIKDQARLSVRNEFDNAIAIQPKVIILGGEEIPVSHPIFQEPLELIFHQQIDLNQLLEELWQQQGLSVLIEAGPTLATQFLVKGLVDEITWISAPLIIGSDGLDGVGELGVLDIGEAFKPQLRSSFKSGVDQVFILDLDAEK